MADEVSDDDRADRAPGVNLDAHPSPYSQTAASPGAEAPLATEDPEDLTSELAHEDLRTRLLRMLVPASLAGGIVALYPSIADRVVEQFGAGFRPGLVTLYVATLVLLFLGDGFLRDLRLNRLRRLAASANQRAAIENERARELSVLLEISSLLEGTDRIESCILKALDRLRAEMPFACASIFVSDSGSGRLVRRGICPLTAVASASSATLARAAFESGSDAHHEATAGCVAFPLRANGETIGALVIEGGAGMGPERDAQRARLTLVSERFASSLATRRLTTELEEKERSIRQAWRELRLSSRRLASSTARAESASLAQSIAQNLSEPLADAQIELKRLGRTLGRDDGKGPLKVLTESLARIAETVERLSARSKWAEKTSKVAVNDVLIAAVDLLAPDFQAARIEVRLALDPNLTPIDTAPDALYQLLIRILQRIRSELRQAPAPRRLTIESLGRGSTAKLVLRANTAGIAPQPGPSESHTSEHKSIHRKALRKNSETIRSLVTAARARVRRNRTIGEGVTYTLTLLGVKEPRLV